MRFLSSLLLLLIVAPLAAQTITQADKAYIDSIMTATYKPGEPGGALLVAVNGKPVYRKAFGLASAELSVANTPELVFRVGSISKQFTAVSMLQLAQAGKLSLDDDIRKHLPWYDTHGRTITLAQLLSHTSGIPSYTGKPEFAKMMDSDISGRGLAEFVMNDSLLFEPGTDWSYSNSGYVLAALVIESASGMTFEKYLQEHIFNPLGMRHSTVGSNDCVIPNAVSGYDRMDEGQFKPAMHLNWTWPYGAGQVLSNVDDMLAWDEALYSDKILSKEWRLKAWTPIVLPNGQKTNYGFGWGVGTWKGLEIIEHGGAIHGFLSDGMRIPEKHIYVIAFSNTTSAPPRFVPDIALRIAGRPIETLATTSVDAKTLQDYVGMYLVTRSKGRLTTNSTAEPIYRAITVSGDTLFSQSTRGPKSALRPVGKDLFALSTSNTFAKFQRDDQARIVAVEIYQEPLTIGPTAREPKTDVALTEEKKGITLDARTLERYRGRYQLVPGFVITVTTEGTRIFGQATGQSRFEMFPQSETVFFLKVVDASMEFILNEKGEVISAVLNQGDGAR